VNDQHPEKLGKYRITEVLGEGAMGVVYKGFDPDIRRIVALKTIRAALDSSTEFGATVSARFRNEAQAAGRLNHPGIVAVYDFGQDEGVSFIAMEFVEGRSLSHYLSTGIRFTDQDIPGVMSQLLDALDHAHAQGVWHRDIKPANIIMSSNGRLKIADFGIARIDSAGLTQAHSMIGTPAYMAPEQFLGTAIDRRVDVYSAGVLLYLLLTGKPPFSGSAEALMYKAVHEQPAPPSKVEGVQRPRFYDSIVATALAKDPNERFATAGHFKQAIENAIGQPFDTTSWDRTIVAASRRPGSSSAEASVPTAQARTTQGSQPSGATATAPTHWDRTLLAQAESSLAQYVGPLASLLVRRAARECNDLPSLYAKLAEKVSDPAARNAFLGAATTSGLTTGGSTALAAKTAVSPISAALQDQARKLLAQHVGPIAGVLVKKAAAKGGDRKVFFAALGEAVSDAAARKSLLAELSKLK
jgi:serine/threonine-protein kinase